MQEEYTDDNHAMLLLEDGTKYFGSCLGAKGISFGEVIFNTGMTGYQEILTDPSYCGQIVIMTTSHLGNYGINTSDNESSKIQVAGFVVRDSSSHPSHHQSHQTLHEHLLSQNVIGIKDISTRQLVKHIRIKGSMRAVLCSGQKVSLKELYYQLRNFPNMEGQNLVSLVACKKPYQFTLVQNAKSQNPKYRIAVFDMGIKTSILKNLLESGAECIVFPGESDANEILRHDISAVFYGNGPGDPASLIGIIDTAKSLIGKIPIMGICLGHQILALAMGAKTYKMKHGHHGNNHPVIDCDSGEVMISSHNHGFAVDQQSLNDNAFVTFKHLNDNTPEGLYYPKHRISTIQFHPEAAPGPLDGVKLFQRMFEQVGL